MLDNINSITQTIQRMINMMAVGPLMIEHRLIERMIELLESEMNIIEKKQELNVLFIDAAVDFIKTYADHCHHGKEEDILFRELKLKDISAKHRKMLDELISDHIYARETTKLLVKARDGYVSGDTGRINDVLEEINKLVVFYPKHIQKEDKSFFIPVMDYFTRKEQDGILNEFWEFDKKLIHEKYKKIIESFEFF